MPDKELEVSCPGCSAIFNVPIELAGEVAECSECGAVFEIPKPEEIQQEAGTETGAIKGKITEESETATNTVKLSRTSIGMIPSLKDSFTFGDPVRPTTQAVPPPPRPGSSPTFAQQPPQTQRTTAPSTHSFPIPSASQQGIQQATPPIESPQFKTQMRTPPAHPQPPQPHAVPPPPVSAPPPPPPSSASSAQKMTFKKPVPTQTQSSQYSTTPPQQNIQLPAWTRIQLRPDEQLYGFREISGNPVGIAFGASLPTLICLVAVFMAKSDAVISYIIVAAIWLIAFITIALISAKSKTFIAFTSMRVIIIAGSKRLEITKQ